MPRSHALLLDSTTRYWRDRPVCVLGGTGFLGRHLVRQLLDAGAFVRTLSLPGSEFGYTHARLNTLWGDISDRATLAEVVAGISAVFLAAGPVGAGPILTHKMGAHSAVLDAVLTVLPPQTRLVLTSSIVAVGATSRGRVLAEDSPFPNAELRVGYVQAKRAAEEAALAAVARGRNIVVVNPGYLFGPDDPGPSVMGQLCVRFWRGHVPFPAPGGLNAVDVRDVAAGHLLAAERGVAGRRYILGGENVRLTDLFAALARAAGLRRRVLSSFRPPLPGLAYYFLAAIAELGHRFTGRDPKPSFEFVRMQRLFWYVSSARAERELGYSHRPLAETLADAFAWHSTHTRVAPRGLNRLWLRAA